MVKQSMSEIIIISPVLYRNTPNIAPDIYVFLIKPLVVMATSALERKTNGSDSPGARKQVAFITGITGQVSVFSSCINQ